MAWEQINSVTVSGSTSSVTVTGIETNDPHALVIEGLNYGADSYSRLRVVRASDNSVRSASSYNWSYLYLRSDTSFAFSQSSGNNAFDIGSTSDANSYSTNIIVYLYNFNNNLMPAMHSRHVHRQSNNYVRGFDNYGFYRVADNYNGVNIFGGNSNPTSARLTLYKIK